MKEIVLYYDGECPICRQYSTYVELRKHFDVKICNAREYMDAMNDFAQKGYNINQGMILIIDDEIYQGHHVIVKLNELLTHQSLFDRCMNRLMNIPYFVRLIYPLIKGVRRIILKIIGVHKINLNQ